MKREETNDLEKIGTVRRSWMTIEANTWGYEGIHESSAFQSIFRAKLRP